MNERSEHAPIGRAPVRPVVLLVEDDFAVRNSLKFSLELEGFSVRAYETGAEFLKDIPFGGADCLIVDYRLPDTNGLDLLAKLRHRHIALPTILVTTNPSALVRARAAAAGVTVIEKPLLSEALLQEIRAMLSR